MFSMNPIFTEVKQPSVSHIRFHIGYFDTYWGFCLGVKENKTVIVLGDCPLS